MFKWRQADHVILVNLLSLFSEGFFFVLEIDVELYYRYQVSFSK